MIESEYVKNITTIEIQVKDEKYLLDVEEVKEIYVPGEKIIPIPLADRSIIGIIDIRGDIYSIISLKHMIYKEERIVSLDHSSRIILLELENFNIALLVDSVYGVREFPFSVFRGHGVIVQTSIDYDLIKSIGTHENKEHVLLDINAIVRKYLTKLDKKALAESVPEVLIPQSYRPKKIRSVTVKPKQEPPIQLVSRTNKEPVLSDDKLLLTDKQKDMLKEIGNIGCGNAVTALSRLIKKKIDVNLTDVGIISFEKLSKQFGIPNQKVCGIFSHIEKPSSSTILQIFEMKSLLDLISTIGDKKLLIDASKVKSTQDLDEFSLSTITEMGNIMAGHYVSALADLTGIKMMIQAPEFTMTNAGLLDEFLSKELKTISDYVILIKTAINIVDLKLNGIFFFIPDLEMIRKFFDKLGFSYKPIIKNQETKASQIVDLSKFKLSEVQRDALQEVGNMGAGNAANALAQMIKKRVDINIPSVEMVELDKFADTISNVNQLIAWSNVTGKTRATILSIFKVSDVVDIASIIVDDAKKKMIDLRKKINKTSDFPEIYRSAISELGHILGSHYTSAIGDLLGIRLMTDPPDMNIDTGKKLFNILRDEIGLLKKLSLVITTNVIITDIKITGSFLFIPSLETLQELLDALLNFYK